MYTHMRNAPPTFTFTNIPNAAVGATISETVSSSRGRFGAEWGAVVASEPTTKNFVA